MQATRHAKLQEGQIYKNRGGGMFRCLRVTQDGAIAQNIKSGWTFFAHVITVYEDRTIEWDFSTGGHFEEVKT